MSLGLDPIESGTAIFKQLANEFGNDKIADLRKIEEFFSRLMEETDGLVILDFLDAANWDKIERFSMDHDAGILTLVWHDYREVEESIEAHELRDGLSSGPLPIRNCYQ